ncbi:hypothetical protein MNBD_GAMMA02-165 [hydrothermal vent metagenome]|uniref:HicA protein n=1 Tax=hydrothermal vent metagenome TaxID=652676 RepID=A0A3B0VPI3_9ZZZZ
MIPLFDIISKMNSKQKKTLENIYSDPVKKNIKWTDVEKLIIAMDGMIKQGNGSRIRILLNDISLNIHTPHPGNELKPYQVRAIRNLIDESGNNDET